VACSIYNTEISCSRDPDCYWMNECYSVSRMWWIGIILFICLLIVIKDLAICCCFCYRRRKKINDAEGVN
jgi:hypothetical protein